MIPFFFLVIIIICKSHTVFIDSSFEGIMENGNKTCPYSKLDHAFENILPFSELENDFTILSNSKNYVFNSKISIEGKITFKYQFKEKNEKAIILFDKFAQIIIHPNGTLFFENMILVKPNKSDITHIFFLEAKSQIFFHNSRFENILISGNQNFIFINENSQIQFINTTFEQIECLDSNFISSPMESAITFDSCQIYSVVLNDSFFLNSNKTAIKLINSVTFNLDMRKIKEDNSLIKSYHGNIYIINIFVYECNFTKFIAVDLGENSEVFINQVVLKKNYGNNGIFLSFVGCNQESNFEIRNIYFVKNQFFAKMIYIKQIKLLKIFQNISFDLNPSAIMLHFEFVEILNLDLIICSHSFISSWPCIRIENVNIFSIKTSFIFENIASSNLNGIQILNNYELFLFKQNLSSIINYYCFGNAITDKISNEIIYGNCMHIDSNQKLALEKSYFFDNTNEDAKTGSPCIYSNNLLAELEIINSFFHKNRAFTKSNCIYYVGISFSVYNSNFEAMKPISEEYDFENAGAIVVSAEKSNFFNIQFIKNQAFKGASLFFRNLNGKKQQIYCEILNITENSAIQTAAIEFDSSLSDGSFFLINSEITNNKVNFYASIASFYYANFDLHFYGCNISFNAGETIGAVFAAFHFYGTVYFENSTFQNNVVEKNTFVGGPVAILYGESLLTILVFYNCSFLDNRSSNKGGVFAILFGDIYDNSSIYRGNSAATGGSVFLFGYCRYNLTNSYVSEGNSSVGGVLRITEATTVNLINTTFEGNMADQGACISLEGFYAFLMVQNCSFKQNFGNQSVIIDISNIDGIIIKFEECLFENNTSQNEFFNARNTHLIVINSLFQKNKGRILTGSNFRLIYENIYINLHICFQKTFEGCLLFSEKSGIISISNILINNVDGNYFQDFILVKFSIIEIGLITLDNITAKNEIYFFVCKQTSLYLRNNFLNKLNFSLAYLFDNSKLFVINNSFYSINNLNQMSMIYCLDCYYAYVSNNLFFRCSFYTGGGLSFISKSLKTFIVEQNLFHEDFSHYGGALHIENQNMLILNNTFSNNQASQGGSLYLKCEDNQFCKWNLTNNKFFNNSALKGGAFHSIGNIPKDNLNYFSQNYAKYGPNFSSFPIKFAILKNDNTNFEEIFECNSTSNSYQDQECVFKNFSSGVSFMNMSFCLLDVYNQKMNLEEGLAFIDIDKNNSQKIILKGSLISKIIKGEVYWNLTSAISQPNSTIFLKLKSNDIPEFYSKYLSANQFHKIEDVTDDYFFQIIVELRPCMKGEIYKFEEMMCYYCPEGKFSLNTLDLECSDCPQNADCYGGDKLIIFPGYWRSGLDSKTIYQCKYFIACSGGYNSSCSDGYSGLLCGTCKLGYFKNSLHSCLKCGNAWIYSICIIVALGIVLKLILMLESDQKQDKFNFILLKIATTHFQTLSLMTTINLDLEIPDFISDIYIFGSPISTAHSIFSIVECFSIGGLSKYSKKIIFSVFGVAFIIILLLFFQFLRILLKKIPKSMLKTKFYISLIIATTFFQPWLINFYIENLTCDEYLSKYFLAYELDQQCYNLTHLIYSILISIPFLTF